MSIIAIEGIDGAGKSTLVELLCERLRRNPDMTVHHRKYPRYDTPTGSAIREILSSNVITSKGAAVIMQSLQAVDRYQDSEFLHRMKSILMDDHVLVLDRYYFSGYFYGASEGLPLDWLICIHRALPPPDLLVVVDVPVDVAVARVQSRHGGGDTYETDARLRRVKAHYDRLSDEKWRRDKLDYRGLFLVVDGTIPPDEIADAVALAASPLVGYP